MSLFPAYSSSSSTSKEEPRPWLKLASYDSFEKKSLDNRAPSTRSTSSSSRRSTSGSSASSPSSERSTSTSTRRERRRRRSRSRRRGKQGGRRRHEREHRGSQHRREEGRKRCGRRQGSRRSRSRSESTSSSRSRTSSIGSRSTSSRSSRGARSRSRRWDSREDKRRRRRSKSERRRSLTRGSSRTHRKGPSSESLSSHPKKSEEEWLAEFSTKKVFLEDTGLSSKHAFVQDFKGDPSFLKEKKGMPQKKVALYRRRFTKVLTSNPSLIYYKSKAKKLLDKGPRFYQRSSILLRGEEALSIAVSMSKKPKDSDLKESVLKLGDAKDKKNNIPAKSTTLLQAEDVQSGDGRQLDGSKKSVLLDPIQEKTRHFNERLGKDVNNVGLWLEYVDFQNECVDSFLFEGEEGTKSKRDSSKNVVMRQRALVERKISILRSAIDKNPKSIKLAIKRLDVSKEILESKVLDRQWQELLFLYPKNLTVWKSYIQFVSSHFTDFSVSKVTKAYEQCFGVLRSLQSTEFHSSELESEMLKMLLSFANFQLRVGYSERSTSLFIAMIELNVFAPGFPGYYGLEDKLATFEQFWESNAPRVGDKGAKGWATIMKEKNTVSQSVGPSSDDQTNNNSVKSECHEEDVLLTTSHVDQESHKAVIWSRIEFLRERMHWKSVTSDLDDIEDEQRIVDFDHISPYLFQLTDSSRILDLILMFLSFLGVDLFDVNNCLDLRTLQTACYKNDYLGLCLPATFGLNSGTFSCSSLEGIGPDATTDSVRSFCSSLLLQLINSESPVISSSTQTQLIWTWVTLQSRHPCTSTHVKSTLKTFLQHSPENLSLYVALAHFEISSKGFKSGLKTLKKIVMQSDNQTQMDSFVTFYVLSKALTHIGDPGSLSTKDILSLLCRLCEPSRSINLSNLEETNMLRAARESLKSSEANIQSELQNMRAPKENKENSDDFRFPFDHMNQLVTYAFCWSFLNLFLGTEAATILTFIENCDTEVNRSSSYSIESMAIKENLLKLKMAILDVSTSLQRLSSVHASNLRLSIITTALESPWSYPFVIGQFDRLGIRARVLDPVWRSLCSHLIHSNDSTQVSPLSVVKVTEYLLQCSEDDGAQSRTLLNWAETILRSSVSRASCGSTPLIWRLYMVVCNRLRRGGKTHIWYQALSTIFYRGMQECPGVKALCLDFVALLIHAKIGSRQFEGQEEVEGSNETKRDLNKELQKIVGIMSEKGVRVRLLLEELDILLEKEHDEHMLEEDKP